VTPAREAMLLPVLFLTVLLAGGLRPGTPLAVAPPSLFALVLAALLVGALVQSGALAPLRLLNGSRSGLANGNGAALLGALFLASAQVFSLLTPESGLPRIVLSLFFLVLMVHTMAAGPDRVHVLRSLAVTFGSAFVLKFVLLDALADPAGGRLGRALQILLEGVTLGTLTQSVQPRAAGYVAFATIALYLVSVWMLPAGPDPGGRRFLPADGGAPSRRPLRDRNRLP
jgi:hypothetical protein